MESLTMDEDGKKATEFEDERIEFNPAAMMERNEISSVLVKLFGNTLFGNHALYRNSIGVI